MQQGIALTDEDRADWLEAVLVAVRIHSLQDAQQPHEAAPVPAAAATSSSTSDVIATRGGAMGGLDIPLILYFLFWYVGNYYYNIVSCYS